MSSTWHSIDSRLADAHYGALDMKLRKWSDTVSDCLFFWKEHANPRSYDTGEIARTINRKDDGYKMWERHVKNEACQKHRDEVNHKLEEMRIQDIKVAKLEQK